MSSPATEQTRILPPPWDRIFSLATRIFVWVLMFGIIYVLRPFFLLIFLTFVFAYIQAHGVDGLAHRVQSRAARVWMVFGVLLGAIFASAYFLAPRVQEQAELFGKEIPQLLKAADAELHALRKEGHWLGEWIIGTTGEGSGDSGGTGDGEPGGGTGEANSGNGEPGGESGTKSGGVQEGTPNQDPNPETKGDQEGDQKEEPEPIVTDAVNELLGMGGKVVNGVTIVKTPAERIDELKGYFTSIIGVTSSFLLSLLFSFLIVLDLSKLRRALAGLADTKVGFIYNEAAENIRDFGKVLGRALEAQLFIAIVNTILTAIGMAFMGLPNLVFLSAIVFLCSFIPVVGVFLSSAPICLTALNQAGLGLMLIAIGLILIIHFIEAYFLNPRIFGHHLRMNPVLVLIVLTVGGKLFGVWGLILGLPIVNYFFRHAIRYNPPDLDDELHGTSPD